MVTLDGLYHNLQGVTEIIHMVQKQALLSSNGCFGIANVERNSKIIVYLLAKQKLERSKKYDFMGFKALKLLLEQAR